MHIEHECKLFSFILNVLYCCSLEGWFGSDATFVARKCDCKDHTYTLLKQLINVEYDSEASACVKLNLAISE